MSTASNKSLSENILPALSCEALASGLGSPLRLEMLREIAMSEGLIIVELAERLGMRATNVSKHMKVLRDCGLVVANRAGMHTIPPGRLVSREEAVVDYGTCLLRLGGKEVRGLKEFLKSEVGSCREVADVLKPRILRMIGELRERCV